MPHARKTERSYLAYKQWLMWTKTRQPPNMQNRLTVLLIFLIIEIFIFNLYF